MQRNLTGRTVHCSGCGKQIELAWSDEWGAELAICDECQTVSFSMNARLQAVIAEKHRRGANKREQLIETVLRKVAQRYSWIDKGIREAIANMLVDSYLNHLANHGGKK